MSELKTLKDIRFVQSANCDEEDKTKNRLRQEAIKWVKNCNCEHRTFPGICFACRRFKEFFNLTEEDLKEYLDDLPVTNCPLKKEIKK